MPNITVENWRGRLSKIRRQDQSQLRPALANGGNKVKMRVKRKEETSLGAEDVGVASIRGSARKCGVRQRRI